MGLVSIEDCSISSRTESVVAEDSVDGVNTSSRGRNMSRGTQESCEGASENHGDAERRRSFKKE